MDTEGFIGDQKRQVVENSGNIVTKFFSHRRAP